MVSIFQNSTICNTYDIIVTGPTINFNTQLSRITGCQLALTWQKTGTQVETAQWKLKMLATHKQHWRLTSTYSRILVNRGTAILSSNSPATLLSLKSPLVNFTHITSCKMSLKSEFLFISICCCNFRILESEMFSGLLPYFYPNDKFWEF